MTILKYLHELALSIQLKAQFRSFTNCRPKPMRWSLENVPYILVLVFSGKIGANVFRCPLLNGEASWNLRSERQTLNKQFLLDVL